MSEVAPLGAARRRVVPPLLNGVLAAGCLALCLIPTGPARWFAGTALVLVLPGDAVRRALGRAAASLDTLVFTVTASLALAVIVGLIADRLSTGVTAMSMGTGLAAAALLADVAAVMQRSAGPQSLRSAWQRRRTAAAGYGAALVAFAMLSSVALVVATRSARQQVAPARTALSMLPAGNGAVTVIVEGGDRGTHTYELVVTQGARQLSRAPLTVRPGQHRTVTIIPVGAAGTGRLTATLTRAGDSRPLRTVWLAAR